VGHDYIDNADERYDFYHTELERVPFDLEIFNKITKGGVPKKTLNVILAGTNVGKSLFMCHMAASALSMGKNVLYVTMEMAEERIAERIDANLLDVPIDSVEKMTKKAFREGVQSIASKSNGRLIIKEYPTAGAHVNHFRALLEELSLKRKFKPDIVFIDYLNICCSSRTKMGGAVNSYTYIKNIAEELRGLAVEQELPIFTATQLNRTGFTNSDPGLEDTSESFGLPATADFMFSMTTNDELESMNQIMIKQLKSRYGNKNDTKRFLVGVDYSKMRIYDIDESQQDLLTEDIPVFDNTDAGRGISKEKLDSLKVF
jgi:replicative DNA helicase